MVICIDSLYFKMREGLGRHIAAKICVEEDLHNLLGDAFLFGIPVCQMRMIKDGEHDGA
jgi:hypothetical protein